MTCPRCALCSDAVDDDEGSVHDSCATAWDLACRDSMFREEEFRDMDGDLDP